MGLITNFDQLANQSQFLSNFLNHLTKHISNFANILKNSFNFID